MGGAKRTALLEQLQQNDGSASAAKASATMRKRRRLERRDTEDKVDRVLASHFKDFSSVDTDGTVKGGKTLRQKLLEEQRERAEGGGRISTATIKALRTEYMAVKDPIKSLTILDKSQHFNADMMRALGTAEAANPAKRSKAPLYSYLETAATMNQKETVVLLRTIVGTAPSMSVALRKHILEILKCVVRLGLYTQFPEECLVLKPVFDETLALTWCAMKAGGMPMEQFWEAYGHLSKPIGLFEDFERIMLEEGSFNQVKDYIMKVTDSSLFGAKLFGAAAVMLKVEDFSAAVDAELVKLKKAKSPLKHADIGALKEPFFCL